MIHTTTTGKGGAHTGSPRRGGFHMPTMIHTRDGLIDAPEAAAIIVFEAVGLALSAHAREEFILGVLNRSTALPLTPRQRKALMREVGRLMGPTLAALEDAGRCWGIQAWDE